MVRNCLKRYVSDCWVELMRSTTWHPGILVASHLSQNTAKPIFSTFFSPLRPPPTQDRKATEL